MDPILLILLVLLIVGVLGTGPWNNHSRGWGYGPSGLLGLVLVVILVVLLMRRF